jgi:hypothetical protein
MADDMPSPPLVYEGLDPSPESKSTIEEVSDAVSVLSNIAREAPLGSLLVAFLLGVAVARRR